MKPSEVSDEDKERVARAICESLGYDPDTQVTRDTLHEIPTPLGVVKVQPLYFVPLWRFFVGIAAIAIAETNNDPA